ncbi:MAG: ActS/PrrB/RegB family redox-sensitive histidine kinase [Pseudomonadota bacterium]
MRVQTSVRLRWFAVAGQAATVAIVFLGLGFDLPVGLCLLVIAISAWLNVYLRIRYSGGHRLDATHATGLLAYDILQLAALLYMTGGIDNPFTVLVVAPVTVSAATLPPRNTIVLGSLAFVVTIALANWHLPLPWVPGETFVLPTVYRFGTFAAVTACLIFLAFYAWRLAKEARQMSAALAATELVLASEQKLHALDGLAAAAAHELGTPLATIVVVAKELEREIAVHPELAEDVRLLQVEALRCREILQKLTRAPTEQDPMHARMTLEQLADEAAEPYRDRRVGIEIRSTAIDGEAPVTERRPGVLFGVGNLIENAVDFASNTVRIALWWSASEVSITIIDDGPGFPPDVLDHIGDPYVTSRWSQRSRTSAGGLGLGVFIAKTLLERSGARLHIANRAAPETGAVVRITWPRDRFDNLEWTNDVEMPAPTHVSMNVT